MVFFKLFVILLPAIVALLQIGLEYKWNDKRTNTHKKVRFILISVIVVGCLASVILVVYDDKKSAERESEAIESRKRIKIELENLQHQIKPVLKLVSEKYPKLDIENALHKFSTDIENLQKQNGEIKKKTKQLEKRAFFQPIQEQQMNIIFERLNQFLSTVERKKITVKVICESGNIKRQKVAKQLVEILSAVGFSIEGPIPVTIHAKAILPAVQIVFNQSDEQIASQLVYSLQPYLAIMFSGKIENSCDKGKISILISGEPIFKEDGTVIFP